MANGRMVKPAVAPAPPLPEAEVASRSALRHLDPFVPQLFLDLRFHLARDLAPQVARVAQLRLAVVQPQVNRLFRFPRDHDGVKAREFTFRRPKAATLRVTHRSGER